MHRFDKAGNLTSHDSTETTCPGGSVFTCSDASQLAAQIGLVTCCSCDKVSNETASGRVADTARRNETWTEYSQLSSITTGGTAYDLVNAESTTTSTPSWARPGSTTPRSARPPPRPTASTPDSSANPRAASAI
ncbi:hypothetical protein [Streptomyces sp. NPDC126514]|uniref:hypothetical protein n=1 Tax=Streptomyces sp. NPDC126514 TaxID=3155210 RepID=UPI00331A960E